MAKRVQLIRHATGTADAFTGLQGEITVDTTKKELRVHDGLNAGGNPQARADLSNVADATAATSGKMPAADKAKLDLLTVTGAVDLDANNTKLAGIESGATADQTGAEIKTAYEGEADTNAYTDAEKTKLAGVESGATADQTAAEIKTAYESNADTNPFTDGSVTKLAGIETGATADQTDAEIKAAVFLTAFKASDETVNNSSTLQNDDDLVLALAANSTYHFKMMILYTGVTSTPDLKWQLVEPDGTFYGLCSRSNPAGGGASDIGRITHLTSATSFLGETNVSLEATIHVEAVIKTGGSGGNFRLQWAQNGATAEDTTVKAGSFMQAYKLD